ncbi:MAG: RDD family protein [Armatimonadetes bacterium]|nr:RDD family protein [Armatimonadota bacterium]
MVCPQCGTLNPDERAACFRCEHSLSPSRVAEEVHCKWHPEALRAANCSVCGTPACDECAIWVEEVPYCPDCAAVPGEERVVPKVERVLTPLEVTTYPCASFGWRLASGIIDGFLIGAGIIVLAFLFWMFTNIPPGMPWMGGSNAIFWGLVLIGVGAYMVSYHVTNGETPGYGACDLLLVRKDGMALTVQIAILRYAVSLISFAFFGIGFLWMLWDPDNQTWHDKAVNTFVLRTSERKELDPEETLPETPRTPEDLRAE